MTPASRRSRHRVPALRGLLLAALFAGVPLATPAARAQGQDVADEVFYHLFPIAWRDSDGDTWRFGDFAGMQASLGYLDSLGVTAIWMNPIFVSPAYHGYQYGPADSLNPRFGTREQFAAFLEAAHARGLRVFIDWVAYGVSHRSPWFRSAWGNPASPYDSWLAFTNGGNTAYQGGVFQSWNADTVGFIHWDLRNAAVRQLVTDWGQLWLDPDGDGDRSDGVDGYRLDHVWAHYPYGPDGWGYHVASFWRPWRDSLRAVNPDVFVFAEQADWGSHGTDLFPGVDASFTKPFEFAARAALSSGAASGLYAQMASTLSALEGAPAPGTFLGIIGDHDVDRLASAIGDDFERGKAAAAVLVAQPFPPILYYGDEIGMRGRKASGWLGDAVDIPFREPMKWLAVAGPPMSNYHALNADAWNHRASRDHDGRSVEEQAGVPGSLLETWRSLIRMRRDHVALRRGAYHAVTAPGGAVWAFARLHADEQVLVAINLASGTQNLALDLSDFGLPEGSTTPEDLLSGATLPAITVDNQDAWPLSLGPFQFRFLRVRLSPPVPPAPRVTGRDLGSRYGPLPRAIQDTPTALGDNVGELDALFVRRADDTLFVALTGNLASDGSIGLALLLDTAPGGQNTLDLSNTGPPPYGPSELTGTRLDDGFAPDHLVYLNHSGAAFYVDQYALLTGGGVSKTYRGQSAEGNGGGTLSGGTNPNGWLAAYDNANTAGVTGSSAAGALSATSGIEFAIACADIGLDGASQSIGLAAFLLTWDGTVGNQWLPGLGGADNLGPAPDLRAVPGDQYAALGLTVDVPPLPPAAPRLRLVGRNPFQDRIPLAFELPRPARVSLEVMDLAGRRVCTLARGGFEAGAHLTAWDGRDAAGRPVRSGVYLARLRGAGAEATVRLVKVE